MNCWKSVFRIQIGIEPLLTVCSERIRNVSHNFADLH